MHGWLLALPLVNLILADAREAFLPMTLGPT